MSTLQSIGSESIRDDFEPHIRAFETDARILETHESESAGLNRAYLTCLSDPDFRESYLNLVRLKASRTVFTPEHSVRFARYAAQAMLLELIDPTLKREKYPSQDEWHDYLRLFYDRGNDEHKANPYSKLEFIYATRNNRRTKYGRALVVPMVQRLYLPDAESVSIVDLGCGGNENLALLHLLNLAAPGHMERIKLQIPPFPTVDGASHKQARALNDLFDRWIEPEMIESYGFDNQSLSDSLTELWTMACGSPDDLYNPQQRQLRRLLKNMRDKSPVNFIYADIVADDLAAGEKMRDSATSLNKALPPNYQGDIAFVSYVLYMLTPEQQQRVLANAQNLARLTIVLDGWDDKAHARVYDRERPELGWEDLAQFDNGYCRRITRPQGKLLEMLSRI